MKVIFLDFDGVLNSATSFLYESEVRKDNKRRHGVKGPVNETLSPHCCAAFQYVLNTYPEVKVVLSTTWRTMFPLDWLRDKLKEYHVEGDRVIDKTPEDRLRGDRGYEIRYWLNEHPEVTHYVIIDDNDWGITSEHGEGRFVHTDWERGMGVHHAIELCKKLKNENASKMNLWDEKRKADIEKAKEELAKASKDEPDNDF